MKHLTYKTIQREAFLKQEKPSGGMGAEVLFFGVVRDQNVGRKVTHLIYEAYESLAEVMIHDLLGEAARKWPLLEAHILHRLGKVEAGQVAVAIRVSSAHRDEAYRASRFLIDEVKAKVPIWKKEYFEDGAGHWGRCDHHDSAQPGSLNPFFPEIKPPAGERDDIKIYPVQKFHDLSREREYLNEMMV